MAARVRALAAAALDASCLTEGETRPGGDAWRPAISTLMIRQSPPTGARVAGAGFLTVVIFRPDRQIASGRRPGAAIADHASRGGATAEKLAFDTQKSIREYKALTYSAPITISVIRAA
jgi:hypothetical protein